MNNNKTFGKDLKIIVVGNSGTGKTSFVNRWTKNQFQETYKATVVSEFGYKIFEFEGKLYKIQLWDIAGQDKSINVTKVFCKDSHGVVIVSDLTNITSLTETLKWKKNIEENTKFMDGTDLPIILVGNKLDLIKEEDLFNEEEEFKSFAEKNNFVSCFRSSAKQNINITEAMEFLVKFAINKMENVNKDKIKKKESIILEKHTNLNANLKNNSNCC